jgi:hypothetical protein
MHRGSEWAEMISLKIWSAPIPAGESEMQGMDVEWESRRGLYGYLVEFFDGIRCLTKRARFYTKLKQR